MGMRLERLANHTETWDAFAMSNLDRISGSRGSRASGSLDEPLDATIGRTLTGFGSGTVTTASRRGAFTPKTLHPAALVRAKATFRRIPTASTEGVYAGSRKFNKNAAGLPAARSLGDLP